MFRALTDFLDSLATPARAAAADQQTVDMAMAVLLVEVMRADTELKASERELVSGVLRRQFALQAADVEQLLARAETKSRQANDFYAFTSVLNERLTQPQKIDIVEHMWQVAYADGDADPWERHIISKVADLLHVTHGEYIVAKLRARDSAQRPGG